MPPEVDGLTRLREVGRGGFGVVYRAWQEELSRFVAVKILTSTLDERAARRFTQECRALGAVSGHPNIVPIYSAGTTDAGEPYLVMPFCDGGSLADTLRTTSVPWADAVRTGVLLAGALHTAHEAGILHRDIKPGNVLVDPYGNPMLGDFGLARMVGEEISRTSSIVATPAYAPPEILAGAEATRGADVYSLAATVLTLIAGHTPFDEPSSPEDGHIAAMVYRVLHRPPVDLRERGVPDAVCAVLERGMAKEPGDRQPSALALAMALREVQQRLEVPVTALPVAGGIPGERTASTPAPTLSEPQATQESQATHTAPAPPSATPPNGTLPNGTLQQGGPTARQTRALPTSRGLVAPLAVMVVAVLAFVALFFVLPRHEVTARAVPEKPAADLVRYLLAPDDYQVYGLTQRPGAVSAFTPLLGADGGPTPVAQCVGLPVEQIRDFATSPTYAVGDPAQTAREGRTDQHGRYAVQSAVLRMATPAAATAMVTRWPSTFGPKCEQEIIDSGLARLPNLRAVDEQQSVTGLAPSMTLPAGMHYRAHRVDVVAALDVQNEYTNYYADFTFVSAGDRVLVTVVNSAPDAPDEQVDAVAAASIAKLRG